MSRASRDDEFSTFVAARQVHLRRIAYAVCGDWHLADDLLQTSLVKLYVAWPRLHQDGREEAYVRQIIVRANIDESRRPWRRERSGLDGHDPVARRELPTEERSALFEALQDLPLMQRRVVVLRHWLGLSVDETARELGIATGTVKSHSSRGIEKLKTALAPADAVDPGRAGEDARPQTARAPSEASELS
ncbi:SigE family RNA polymerase sigma factor [Nocardioides panacis]|uniref:SigE family RNA polymerase sigma factor n=1 Tax=Nocardioides panacis TaxID=2849501 RepID=A0A975T331_9ACTN|nr:SigE family RNA polymerase sigma factor [Nocardioides panacis]QWZ09984.1 SigE family RNA polymerase sigma factor [Nocardioides panacis]